MRINFDFCLHIFSPQVGSKKTLNLKLAPFHLMLKQQASINTSSSREGGESFVPEGGGKEGGNFGHLTMPSKTAYYTSNKSALRILIAKDTKDMI